MPRRKAPLEPTETTEVPTTLTVATTGDEGAPTALEGDAVGSTEGDAVGEERRPGTFTSGSASEAARKRWAKARARDLLSDLPDAQPGEWVWAPYDVHAIMRRYEADARGGSAQAGQMFLKYRDEYPERRPEYDVEALEQARRREVMDVLVYLQDAPEAWAQVVGLARSHLATEG